MPSAESLLFVALVFLLAGAVKGVVGMGLPTLAMGALGLVMAPVQAAALLVLPSLITNAWQFAAGPATRAVLRRLAVFLLLLCAGTAAGIPFLTQGGSRWPSFALGVVLAVYGVIGLLLPRMTVAPRHERWAAPLAGGITGVLTGATGVFVVPAVPYLGALGLDKDELVQALGLSFTVSTVALAAGLLWAGKFPQDIALTSVLAVVPALLGMLLGQRVRDRLDAASFRRWFLVAMLLIGGYMALRAL